MTIANNTIPIPQDIGETLRNDFLDLSLKIPDTHASANVKQPNENPIVNLIQLSGFGSKRIKLIPPAQKTKPAI